MKESGYYPPGAEFDKNAPYNQPEPEGVTFPTQISYTLTANTNIVSDYHEGGYIDYDEDGGYQVPYHFLGNSKDTEEAFQRTHKTPCQLLADYAVLMAETLQLLETENNRKHFQKITQMRSDIADCLMWQEELDDCSVEDTK